MDTISVFRCDNVNIFPSSINLFNVIIICQITVTATNKKLYIIYYNQRTNIIVTIIPPQMMTV